MSNVEEKLEQLQAGLRRQKALTVVLVAGLLVTYLTGLAGPFQSHYALAEEKKPQPVPRYPLLQAERFELVNSKGELLAALMPHESSGRPVIALFDKEGDARAALTLSEAYHPVLTFQDAEHRQRLRLYLNEDFSGQLDMFDENKIANIELKASDTPSLIMRTGDIYARTILGVSEEGSMLTLVGKDGDNRASVGVDVNGKPLMTLTNDKGEDVFKAPK